MGNFHPINFVALIGRAFLRFLATAGRLVLFAAAGVSHIFRPPFYYRLIWRQMVDIGYYSLPVMHDGVFIGRVDLKTHRDQGVLEARHAHFEPWFAAGQAPPGAAWGEVDRDAALTGLAGALADLAAHVGASRVQLGRVTPAKLRAPLARALSGAPSGSPSVPRRGSRRTGRS